MQTAFSAGSAALKGCLWDCERTAEQLGWRGARGWRAASEAAAAEAAVAAATSAWLIERLSLVAGGAVSLPCGTATSAFRFLVGPSGLAGTECRLAGICTATHFCCLHMCWRTTMDSPITDAADARAGGKNSCFLKYWSSNDGQLSRMMFRKNHMRAGA